MNTTAKPKRPKHVFTPHIKKMPVTLHLWDSPKTLMPHEWRAGKRVLVCQASAFRSGFRLAHAHAHAHASFISTRAHAHAHAHAKASGFMEWAYFTYVSLTTHSDGHGQVIWAHFFHAVLDGSYGWNSNGQIVCGASVATVEVTVRMYVVYIACMYAYTFAHNLLGKYALNFTTVSLFLFPITIYNAYTTHTFEYAHSYVPKYIQTRITCMYIQHA